MNNLQELIKNNSNWRELLNSKKIKIKEDDNFLIFNYDIGANFSDEVVKDCRGIILDKNDFSIACNPFRKFGNYFESYADNIDWSSARVLSKEDGSLIKLFFNKYTSSWQWATNSTIDSRNATINSLRFKNYFEMLIRADNFYDLRDIDINYTYLFELVGPENQIVLKYNKIHLYHIGTRHNETGQEVNVDIGIEKPKEYKLSNFDDCLKAIKELNKDGLNHEGFVVVDKYYNRIKIKTPEYVAMHHLSNNGETITNKAKVIELLRSDDFNEGELLKQYPNYRKVFNHYKSEMARVEKEVDDYILYARAHYKMSKGDRKYIANKIKDIKYSSVLFKSLGNNKTVKELLNDCSDKLYLSWIDDYKE